MTLSTATISGTFVRPDDGRAAVTAYIEAATQNSLLTYSGGVIASKTPVKIQADGTATVTIWQLPQAGILPADARWRLVMESGRDRYIKEFTLTSDMTWNALVDVTGTPMTPSLVALAQSAATAAASSAGATVGMFGQSVASFGTLGTSDDTPVFAAAIASGKKHLYVPPGTYIVNNVVMNQAGQMLHLAAGATLKAKAGGSQTVLELAAAGVQVIGYGATIDASSLGGTAGCGILGYANNQVIEGISMTGLAGLGMNLVGSSPSVRNCTITNAGNVGIYVHADGSVDITDADISGNKITSSAVANVGGIKVSAGTHLIYTARIERNTITLDTSGSSSTGIGIELNGPAARNSIVGNTTVGGTMGISMSGTNHDSCTGNTSASNTFCGFELAAALYCSVSGCTVDGGAVCGAGVSISNSGGGHHTVTGCTINNLTSSGSGVVIQGTNPGCTVTGCDLTAHTPIVFAGQYGYTAVGNNLYAAFSAGAAVTLDTTTDSIVAHNVCYGFASAAVTSFGGAATYARQIIGPNVLAGGTPADLINGWTPGTNGVGARLIRGSLAPAGASAVTVTASPWTYTWTDRTPGVLYIKGGTVSAVTKNSQALFAQTNVTVALEPGETVTVTYSSAPTAFKDVK